MGSALTRLGPVPQDWAPTQTGSRVTGGLVVDGLGDGAVVAGVVLAGAAVVTAGLLPGVALWSAWLARQPVRARLASSRAVAMVRMGRMMLIPFGSGVGGPRVVRSPPITGTSQVPTAGTARRSSPPGRGAR